MRFITIALLSFFLFGCDTVNVINTTEVREWSREEKAQAKEETKLLDDNSMIVKYLIDYERMRREIRGR